MFGSAFITHPKGWLCSNEAMMQEEQDLIEVDGKECIKLTPVMKVKAAFDGIGTPEKDMPVECVFKLDDSDKMQGFIGVIQGITNETIKILLTTKTERIPQILKKIKEEI